MNGDHWNVTVSGNPDGKIERLGSGHAWVWTRADGTKEVFDCGLAISHVVEYAARRLRLPSRAVDAVRA